MFQNYGPWIASSPTGCVTSNSIVGTKSGSPVSIFATVIDAYNQTVTTWPELQSSLQCVAAYSGPQSENQPLLAVAALSGTTAATYADGSAFFSAVSVSGPVGAVFVLHLVLSSPSSLLSSSAEISAVPWKCLKNITVTILPCDPVEQFDGTANRCVCVPNSARIQQGTLTTALFAVRSVGMCVCLPTFYWDAALQTCAACPEGAYCSGGAIYSIDGWWRASADDPRTFSCRPEYCVDEFQALSRGSTVTASSDGVIMTARNSTFVGLPTGSACAEGHSGPLCAICNPGWTLQGDACKFCPPGAAWGAWARWRRVVLITGVLVSSTLVVLFGFIMQILPEAREELLRCDLLTCLLFSRRSTVNAQ